jgi:hypothetical protein
LYAFLISSVHVTCLAHLIILHINNIWWRIQAMKALSITFSPAACYFLFWAQNICVQTEYHCNHQLKWPANTTIALYTFLV